MLAAPPLERVPRDRRVRRRRRRPRFSRGGGRRAGGVVAHLLALAQTLVVAQVGIGLLLLSDHKRAPDQLHYAYGVSRSSRCSRRGSTRRPTRARACSGSAVATLVAAALAVRAYTTAT